MMLSSQGIKAIDWLGAKTLNPIYAWRFYQWYKKNFGLHIQLFDGRKFRDAGRIADSGPLVWKQEALRLSVPKTSIAQLRFEFLADNWMIDWIGVSFDGSEADQITLVECNAIENLNLNRQQSIDLIQEKDHHYFITHPGESYLLKFKLNPVPIGKQRSYFLKSRGFYIEWIRSAWIKRNLTEEERMKFELNDRTIIDTAHLWLEKKHSFEKEFYESKVSLKGGE